MADLLTKMRLPLETEAVNAAWLQDALALRLPGLSIRSAEIADVILGTSTKIRARLESNISDFPQTLIVKGGFEAHSPVLAEMYRNEALFYAAIQPNITMGSPRCYFAGTDPDSHQSIVILEDLNAAQVKWLDPLVPLDIEVIADRLRAMAHYHAQSWESVHFASGGIWERVTPRFGGWSMDYVARYLEPDVWSHYTRSPRGAAISTRFHDREWVRGAFRKFAEIEAAGPRCLIHGDTHLGNLYFTADGRPGFLDAQVGCSHWSFEVAYHIVCACDLADRPRWEHDLFRIYLEAMAVHGIAMPAFDEAFASYSRAIGYGLFIFLINEIRFQTEAVNKAYAARFGAAALQHRTQQLLQ